MLQTKHFETFVVFLSQQKSCQNHSSNSFHKAETFFCFLIAVLKVTFSRWGRVMRPRPPWNGMPLAASSLGESDPGQAWQPHFQITDLSSDSES